MVYAIVEKCDLCGKVERLHDAHYQSYPMFDDPARPMKLRLCSRCWSGWDGRGGMYKGGSRLADRMLKNLHKVTKRPFEWSLHLPPRRDGAFSIHEGTVRPGMKASDF
jgi:hypothetical protein